MLILQKFFASLSLLYCLCGTIDAASPTTKVKAVVFDYGGVVSELDKTVIIQFLSDSFRISSNVVKEVLDKRRDYTSQGGDEQQFWNKVAQSTGVELPPDWSKYWCETRLKAIKEIAGVNDVVRALRHAGYKTAMLSNVTQEQAYYVRQRGCYDDFQPLLLSYEIGVEKPNTKAFAILLDRLKLAPDEILFIDDSKENVDAAKELGFDSIQFVNAARLLMELNKRGITLQPE